MRRCVLILIALSPGLAAAQASPWGTPGASVPPAAIIATAGKAPPPEARLPLPDDGLRLPAPAAPRPLDPALVRTSHADAPSSAVTVIAAAPAVASEGQAVAVTITVRNPGTAAAGPLTVRLPLPPGASLVDAVPAAEPGGQPCWRVEHLAPGAERILRVGVLAGPGGDALALRPEVTFAAAGTSTRIIRPPLGLSIRGPDQASAGDRATFRIRVANNTRAQLRKVSIGCILPESLAHAHGQRVEADLPGGLAPGEARTEELVVIARTPGNPKIDITARADGGLSNRAEANVVVTQPALTLALTGPRRIAVGQEADFSLSVGNPGGAVSGPVGVSVPLPAGLEFVAAGQSGISTASGVSWSLPPLVPQGRHTLALRVRGAKGGDWALAGTATAGTTPARHACAVLVEFQPRLVLDLPRLDGESRVGQEVSLEFRLSNPGPGSAEQVRVALTLPPHLVPSHADGPARWRVDGQRVLFEPITSAGPRVDAIFRVRARAASAGSGTFRAEVSAAGLADPLTREAVCTVRP